MGGEGQWGVRGSGSDLYALKERGSLHTKRAAVTMEAATLEPSTAGAKTLKLMVIGPGFGGGLEGPKGLYLAQMGHAIDFVELPEPTAGDQEAREQGSATLRDRLLSQPPDVLIASSRGGWRPSPGAASTT